MLHQDVSSRRGGAGSEALTSSLWRYTKRTKEGGDCEDVLRLSADPPFSSQFYRTAFPQNAMTVINVSMSLRACRAHRAGGAQPLKQVSKNRGARLTVSSLSKMKPRACTQCDPCLATHDTACRKLWLPYDTPASEQQEAAYDTQSPPKMYHWLPVAIGPNYTTPSFRRNKPTKQQTSHAASEVATLYFPRIYRTAKQGFVLVSYLCRRNGYLGRYRHVEDLCNPIIYACQGVIIHKIFAFAFITRIHTIVVPLH